MHIHNISNPACYIPHEMPQTIVLNIALYHLIMPDLSHTVFKSAIVLKFCTILIYIWFFNLKFLLNQVFGYKLRYFYTYLIKY